MSIIADNISRSCIAVANGSSRTAHLRRCSWKLYTEMLIYRLYKPRTVSTMCKACTTPYIRISDKTAGILHNRLISHRPHRSFRLYLLPAVLPGLLLPLFWISHNEIFSSLLLFFGLFFLL